MEGLGGVSIKSQALNRESDLELPNGFDQHISLFENLFEIYLRLFPNMAGRKIHRIAGIYQKRGDVPTSYVSLPEDRCTDD